MTELISSGPPHLLLRPRPLPDEWIGSWIVRLAAANHAPLPGNPRRLLKTLGIDSVEDHLTTENLTVLSSAVRIDFATLQALNNLPTDLIQKIGRPINEALLPVPFLGVRYIVICPLCLKEDLVPYFRLSWLSWSTVACSTHGGPLYDGCPHCDARLCVRVLQSNSKSKGRQAPVGLVRRTQADLRRCWKCSGDLTTQVLPIEISQTRAEMNPAPFTRKIVTDASACAPFIHALRTFISAYGLFQLDRIDNIKPYLMPSPLTAYARFHTERILTWLLTQPTGEVVDPARQLKVIAERVLRLLDPPLQQRSALRWYHISWLSTSLLNETGNLFRDWPDEVHIFVSWFEKRKVDPRPVADFNFRIHDESWQLMAPVMSENSTSLKFYGYLRPQLAIGTTLLILDAILQNIAGISRKIVRKSGQSYHETSIWLKYWRENGQLGFVLEQLYQSVSKYRFHLLIPSLEEPEWVNSTVAVLMSDGCIELTRTISPALHRVLFLELIRALDETNS
ncbi:TniQ family protein [Deinococcus sp. UYEF24]